MKTIQEEVDDLAKIVHDVLGDEICDHQEATTGYTYCEDIAKTAMEKGWLSTDEHMEVVATAAQYSGQVNANLRDRLYKAESEANDLKEALGHTRDILAATRRQRDNRQVRAKIAEGQVSQVEDLIARTASRSGVVLVEDLVKALRQADGEEEE